MYINRDRGPVPNSSELILIDIKILLLLDTHPLSETNRFFTTLQIKVIFSILHKKMLVFFKSMQLLKITWLFRSHYLQWKNLHKTYWQWEEKRQVIECLRNILKFILELRIFDSYLLISISIFSKNFNPLCE